MDPIWLEHYPPGVPAEVDTLRYASLKALLEQSCVRFGARPAFTSMGVSLSYGELDRLSRNFGAWLQREAGLRRGDRVAIMLPNLLQYPVALFGALRAGMVVVNVNPLYTARELQYQLADSGAAAIVVLENFAHTLQGAISRTAVRQVVTTRVGDLFPPLKGSLVNFAVKWIKRGVPRWKLPGALRFDSVLRRGAQHELAEVPLTQDDIAFLQYSGGTTGVAKGAILTHGNLVANVEQTSAWIGSILKEGEEVVITPLPLYHVFALTANLLIFVKWGANDVLIANPRDIPGLVREMRKTRFTVMSGVNTLYNKLLDDPGFDRVRQANAGALKLAVAGGMSLQRTVAERWQQRMGLPLMEGYGLTEASPIVCANPLDATGFSGAIGMPIPSTQVEIRDAAGNALPPGQAGELCIRGPQVMRGYWEQPEETACVLSADGWLRSGDICEMDARGMVRFIERSKDVIVVSGFKVYPNEVEDVLMLHPGVSEAGVIGVADAVHGETVKAFVVKRDPALTDIALIAHCRANLAAYKVPKQVEFRDALPKSPVGKIMRRMLREGHA
ncbi:MAG: AMP-binding protein [Thiobacillus sp.]|uniref:AMP-binding protein n=1 Tax=Thiobacillus sp. TaxID=924 RepID=UPI002894F013|nr:AMP-binding protein [Thiobacillus sp.]MDT3708187.1 AMP-binding protein [Thiobacillus sp.]